MHERSGGVDPGRDGCRVPLPWSGDRPPFGFSPEGAATWLPQPSAWAVLTVEAQEADPGSTLALYRRTFALRRVERDLHTAPLDWLPSAPDVLAFARGEVTCVVNLGPEPVELPPHQDVLLLSGPLDAGRLPRDTAGWLRTTQRFTERIPGHGSTPKE